MGESEQGGFIVTPAICQHCDVEALGPGKMGSGKSKPLVVDPEFEFEFLVIESTPTNLLLRSPQYMSTLRDVV